MNALSSAEQRQHLSSYYCALRDWDNLRHGDDIALNHLANAIRHLGVVVESCVQPSPKSACEQNRIEALEADNERLRNEAAKMMIRHLTMLGRMRDAEADLRELVEAARTILDGVFSWRADNMVEINDARDILLRHEARIREAGKETA